MNYLNRYIEQAIIEDLNKKMVFITGPRQTGKTTLARHILNSVFEGNQRTYMNWDAQNDRESIIREQFPSGNGGIVFDEIHKYSRWRQVIKGLYDKRHDELKIIVTGSGKLDYYRHGGDSLQGRYHLYRLHPMSLKEINLNKKKQDNLFKLFRYGGFPEPFSYASERESRRWSKEYRSRIINEDLNSLENVKDIALIENLAYRLPELTGSPLSINSLKLDLQVAHQTIARWIQMLENIFMIFRLYPFGSPKIRAVKKEAKHYHFDWTLIDDDGIRFENLMACHLLKWCHYRQDYYGEDIELRYFRDTDKREVDFVVLNKKKPVLFIECKLKNKTLSQGLKYLKNKFKDVPSYQLCLYECEQYQTKDNIIVMSGAEFLVDMI